MRGRRCRRGGRLNIGIVITAFGIGLVIAFICPKSLLVAILALALIALGIIIAK